MKDRAVIDRLHLSKPVIFALSAVVLAAALMTVYAIIVSQSNPDLVIINDPTSPSIAVEIRGEVNAPGVYRFDFDARVADLIAAAGGTTDAADLASINLAERVADGAQITIPAIGAATPMIASQPTAQSTSAPMAIGTGKININRASQAELESLPGIGPVLAARIIEWRTSNGPFASVEDLEQVEGISASTVSDLAPYATAGP